MVSINYLSPKIWLDNVDVTYTGLTHNPRWVIVWALKRGRHFLKWGVGLSTVSLSPDSPDWGSLLKLYCHRWMEGKKKYTCAYKCTCKERKSWTINSCLCQRYDNWSVFLSHPPCKMVTITFFWQRQRYRCDSNLGLFLQEQKLYVILHTRSAPLLLLPLRLLARLAVILTFQLIYAHYTVKGKAVMDEYYSHTIHCWILWQCLT